MSQVEAIIHALNTGGRHLGDLIFWQLSDAAVDRATFESRWQSAGLPSELLPEPPTAEKALKTAVREAAVGQHNRLIRLAVENETTLGFAIVFEEKHPETGTLTYTQEARVTMDRAFGTIGTDNNGHEVVQAIVTKFNRLLNTHTADDVRRTITRTLASFNSVTLRESGGIYWVPAPYAKHLRQLQACVQQFGHSEVYLLPVHDSSDANRTLGDVAQQSLEVELESLKTEIAAFVAQPPERTSTLVRRFDAFEALRGRAQLYRDILNVQVKDLDSTLTQLTDSIEKLLAQKQAA